FAGSVALGGGGAIYVGGGNTLAALRYHPDAPASQPAMPQSPSPEIDGGAVALQSTLRWGPVNDTCDPLEYDVYFGIADDPPFAGHVNGEPQLDVSKMDPNRTYHWRVEAIDAQGNRARGPLWRFTTVHGVYP